MRFGELRDAAADHVNRAHGFRNQSSTRPDRRLCSRHAQQIARSSLLGRARLPPSRSYFQLRRSDSPPVRTFTQPLECARGRTSRGR
jgi:hypothetical protein